jgi:hypothetical protein
METTRIRITKLGGWTWKGIGHAATVHWLLTLKIGAASAVGIVSGILAGWAWYWVLLLGVGLGLTVALVVRRPSTPRQARGPMFDGDDNFIDIRNTRARNHDTLLRGRRNRFKGDNLDLDRS